MFVRPEDRSWGEEPQRPSKVFIRSSKGYPEKRDPQADNPTGVLPSNVGPAYERKLRQRYAPQQIYKI